MLSEAQAKLAIELGLDVVLWNMLPIEGRIAKLAIGSGPGGYRGEYISGEFEHCRIRPAPFVHVVDRPDKPLVEIDKDLKDAGLSFWFQEEWLLGKYRLAIQFTEKEIDLDKYRVPGGQPTPLERQMAEALKECNEYARCIGLHTENPHALQYAHQIEMWADKALAAFNNTYLTEE